MSHEVSAFLHLGFVMIIVYSVICRASRMDANTLSTVKWQHKTLAASAVCSLHPSLSADWSLVVLSAGVVGFLMFSSYRWKRSAPIGTIRKHARSAWLSE